MESNLMKKYKRFRKFAQDKKILTTEIVQESMHNFAITPTESTNANAAASIQEVASLYRSKYGHHFENDMMIITAKKKQSGVATKSNPALWSRCKSEAKAKMGGKHSARAMQLAVKLYKQRGGKYKGKKPTARTNKMKKWTKQKWMYLSDYKKKKKKDKNKIDDHLANDLLLDSNDAKGRYLPEAKWKSLKPKEREATDQKKKREGKRKQYVPNTEKAKVKSKAKYY